MISRRGFFGMIAGLAASPALAPLAKLFPQTYTTYLVGADAFVRGDLLKLYYNKQFLAVIKANTPLLAHLRPTNLPKFEGGKTIQFVSYAIKEGV